MKKLKLFPLIVSLIFATNVLCLTACGPETPPENTPNTGHSHNFVLQNTSDAFLAKTATCTQKAQYYFSCDCGAKDTKTFDHGEPLGHSYTNYVFNNDSSCHTDGTETATCDNGCGTSNTRTKECSTIPHSFSKNEVCNNDGTILKTCECGFSKLFVDDDILVVSDNVLLGLTEHGKTLTKIVVPEDITRIEDGAFANCTTLENLSIPNSLTSVGSDVFVGCSSLTTTDVKQPGDDFDSYYGATYLGNKENPYLYCHSWFKIGTGRIINIHEDCKFIGSRAFKNSGFYAYNLPEGLLAIGSEAFRNCDRIESFSIPSTVNTIGDYAIYECDELTTVYIRDGITKIGKGLFINCPSLKGNIDGDFQYLGDEVNKYTYLLGARRWQDAHKITSAEINSNCKYIGIDAFYNCSALTSVTIPSGVKYICSAAFSDTRKLPSLVIPKSVERIDSEILFWDFGKVYCEAESKPDGWASDWALVYRNAEIIWGYKP